MPSPPRVAPLPPTRVAARPCRQTWHATQRRAAKGSRPLNKREGGDTAHVATTPPSCVPPHFRRELSVSHVSPSFSLTHSLSYSFHTARSQGEIDHSSARAPAPLAPPPKAPRQQYPLQNRSQEALRNRRTRRPLPAGLQRGEMGKGLPARRVATTARGSQTGRRGERCSLSGAGGASARRCGREVGLCPGAARG